MLLCAACSAQKDEQGNSAQSKGNNNETATPVSDKVVILSRSWFETLNNAEQETVKQRPALKLMDGKTASNCQEYLNRTAPVAETQLNFSRESEYLTCDLIKLVGKQPLKYLDTAHLPTHYGAELQQRLLLRSFPSSFGPRIDRTTTAAQLSNPAPEGKPQGLRIDNEDQYFDIHVLAVGDFNHNGVKDWVLQVTDQFHDGTYNTVSGLILYDVKNDGSPLSATAINQGR